MSRRRRSGHIHREIAERFRRYDAKGVALDLPVGAGENARTLVDAGFRVLGADIGENACRAAAAEGAAVQRVDMTRPLPYRDESFDAVLHSEGIEHVDNQLAVLRELARVLKPGGIAIVTTPNLLHLEGRLYGLLTGHPRNKGVVAEPAEDWRDPHARERRGDVFGHVFLIDAFQLRFYLRHVGLEVLDIDTQRYSRKSLFLAPLLLPPVWLATRRMIRRRRSQLHPAQQRELLRQILSPALLFGRKAIFVARKPA